MTAAPSVIIVPDDLPKVLNAPPAVANPKIPRLVDLCLDTILKNFDKCSNLDEIPKKYRQFVIQNVPITIDLQFAVMAIPDGAYWKKRTLSVFPRITYDPKTSKWKQMFLENYASRQLENATPETLDSIFDELRVIGPFIRTIKLTRTPCKVSIFRLFHTFRTLRNLTLVYGEPRRNFAQYDEFESFNVTPENSATFRDCQALCSDLETLGTSCPLQCLDMSDNSLNDTSFAKVARGLSALNSLTTLRFAYNEIKSKGVHALVDVLTNSPIRHLDLSHNQIGSEGVHDIIVAANKMNTIEELNLSSNKFGNKGIMSISILVSETKSLQSLDISGNNISNFEEMIPAIQKNTTLRLLNISANPISEEFYDQLQEIANKSTTLQKVDMRRYEITDQDFLIKTTETSEAPLLRFK